jgi:hypothetical protein
MVQSLIPVITNTFHDFIRDCFSLPFKNYDGKSQMLKLCVGKGRVEKLLFYLFKETLLVLLNHLHGGN